MDAKHPFGAAAPSSPELQDQQFIVKVICLVIKKTQASGWARQMAYRDSVLLPAVNEQVFYDVHESGKNSLWEVQKNLS